MKEKKIIALLTLLAVCLIAFNNESKAQNDAQVAKDLMTQVNGWDNVLRTVDTTPTTTTNQATVQSPTTPLNQSSTRDNSEPTQLSTTLTVNSTKALKEPVKPNVNANVSINQQAIDNVKANVSLNRVLPTQQQIRDLIIQKKSGN